MKVTPHNAFRIFVPMLKKRKEYVYNFFVNDEEFEDTLSIDVLLNVDGDELIFLFPLKDKNYTKKELRQMLDKALENKEELIL